MSKVIFIRGYPGSGKSTLARKISESNSYRYAIVEPEKINLINSDPSAISVKKYKYKKNLEECIGYLEQRKDVLWAQPWRDMQGLQTTIDNIKYLANDKVEFLVIEIIQSPEITWINTRIRLERDGYTKDKYFDHFVKQHEKFNIPDVEYLKTDHKALESIKLDLAL